MKILYSHGFGVDETGRGLFTDIAAALPEFAHMMFAYDYFDQAKNQLVTSSLPKNAQLLSEKYGEGKDNISVIIAHSQGCISAALADLPGLSQVILLAPPTSLGTTEQRIAKMMRRDGTVANDDGSVAYPRRDGSTTLVTKEYMEGNESIDPIAAYNDLATRTKVAVVRATEDEVLSINSLEGLDVDSVRMIELSDVHDFLNNRQGLVSEIKDLLKTSA